MSGRVQIAFGLVFVALGVGALTGELSAADQNGRDPNIGWIIGAAGFGLPGLLNIAIGIGRGGLKLDWSDASMARRLAAGAGVSLMVFGTVEMAYGLHQILVTTGGDCGTRFAQRQCPSSSEHWFVVTFVSMPAVLLGIFLTAFADRESGDAAS